jgi:hypothetical protein
MENLAQNGQVDFNEEPRRKQRGIVADFFSYTPRGVELHPQRRD